MVWATPKGYTKGRIDWAGNVLVNESSSQHEKDEAINILDNWRAVHAYPMHVFKQRLKRVSEKLDANALSVQRLKRAPSILKKLKRGYYGNKPTMKLSQMQDISGCRVVMSNVELAKKLYKESYIRGDLKHKKVNEKDYISNPKPDGYRSIHLIYRYNSDKEGKKDFNRLLVEVQIRSKLQHLWATAVETVDFFTRQAIKSNEGEREWAEFFRLVSSFFAGLENCPIIEGTPKEKEILYSEIKRMEKELQVVTKMKHWTKSIKLFESVRGRKDMHFFLLELDTTQEKLNISSYPKSKEQKAILDYSDAEKKNSGRKDYDVVLVGADTTNDLKKAYPNYFVDTNEFLVQLAKVLDN